MHGNKQHEYPSVHHRLIGYPYRVWVFSIILTPLLAILWGVIESKDHFEFSIWNVIGYFGILALTTALSAPSMAIYMLAFWKLINSGLPVIFKKLLLLITAATCIWLTVFFAGDLMLGIFGFKSIIIYSAVISILSFSLSLREK